MLGCGAPERGLFLGGLLAADTSCTRWFVRTGVLRGRGLYAVAGDAGDLGSNRLRGTGVVHALCGAGG